MKTLMLEDDASSHKNDFVTVTIELDSDVLDAFRAMGADWQRQINVALRQWLQEHPIAHSMN